MEDNNVMDTATEVATDVAPVADEVVRTLANDFTGFTF